MSPNQKISDNQDVMLLISPQNILRVLINEHQLPAANYICFNEELTYTCMTIFKSLDTLKICCNTVMILNFRTDRSGQTVQTQITDQTAPRGAF